MFYVSPQGLSRAPQEASRSSQNSPKRIPGAAKMTPGAAQAAPRGAQDSPGEAQEPSRSTQDAPRSRPEGHKGRQEAPQSLPGPAQRVQRCSKRRLCRARSTNRRGYKNVLCTKLAQTCSQHREGPVQLDMWISTATDSRSRSTNPCIGA